MSGYGLAHRRALQAMLQAARDRAQGPLPSAIAPSPAPARE